MSSFTCACGKVTRKADETPETSGFLISISALVALERQIARTVAEFHSLSDAQRDIWLQEHFHAKYPPDLSVRETVQEIISREVNGSNFSSTFLCPECGRFAVAFGPDRKSWSFFSPE